MRSAPENGPCMQCGRPINRRTRNAAFCFPCTELRKRQSVIALRVRRGQCVPSVTRKRQIDHRLAVLASRFTRVAVECGLLPKLDGTVKCTDCDGAATCYDHRDYTKPLDVDPVCHGCNCRRGSAAPITQPRAA